MQQQGNQFEQHAQHFLTRQGLQLVEKNYRCYWGEIDLVMRQDKRLIFVEVRQRRPSRYLRAAETVGKNKQRKLIQCAGLFLRQNPQFSNMACRFDVVAYDCKPCCGTYPSPHWLRGAFVAG